MSQVEYYNYGFTIADVNILTFVNYSSTSQFGITYEEAHAHNWTCPDPDSDIAGIGVVTSFLVAGVMTTVASIIAAVLESKIDDGKGGLIFMPGFIHRWLSRGMTPKKRERCRFWRDILERLILNLADQQLITGISLLVIGFIVQPWPLSGRGRLWPARLSLVIYLSCLSSSSHLACMLSLHKYLKEHPGLARLRMLFIVIFALFLSISIGLGQTYSVLGYFISWVLVSARGDDKYESSLEISNIIFFVVPPLIALQVYFTAILQLMPSAQNNIKRFIRSTYHSHGSKVVPSRLLRKVLGLRWSAKLGTMIKRLFWFLLFLNPPVIFAAQIIFAIISIVFILGQKFAQPPTSVVLDILCPGLNNKNENAWGFGQMLAMFVLVLPFLSAIETYQEEHTKHRRRMSELNASPKSTPATPTHSRTTSDLELPALTNTNSGPLRVVNIDQPCASPYGLHNTGSQYMLLPTGSPHGSYTGDIEDQRGQMGYSTQELTEVPRTYLPYNN